MQLHELSQGISFLFDLQKYPIGLRVRQLAVKDGLMDEGRIGRRGNRRGLIDGVPLERGAA